MKNYEPKKNKDTDKKIENGNIKELKQWWRNTID